MTNKSSNVDITLGLLTYNRHSEVVELIRSFETINAFTRCDHSLEIILIDDHSDTPSDQMVDQIKEILSKYDNIQFKFFRNQLRLGCTKNRNRIFQIASGDIIIFIDDDSLACDPLFFNKIYKILKSHEDVAIFAFPVYNIYYNHILVPHKRKKWLKKYRFYTYYFMGGGHAVKKNIIKTVGGYSEELSDRGEEYDLAFKVINSGYKILYSVDTFIIHLQVPHGRMPQYNVIINQSANKILIAWKYYPFIFVLTNAIIWTIYAIVKTKKIRSILDVWQLFLLKAKSTRRKPLKDFARNYLKETQARLWY